MFWLLTILNDIKLICYFSGFKQLQRYGVHVPRYALVNREVPYQELDYFVEQEDFVEVHGNRFWKPFVEKPVDGEFDSYIIKEVVLSMLLLVVDIYTI